MSDKSKNVKIFIVLMIIVGVLLIGLMGDSYVYYNDIMDEYSEIKEEYSEFDEPLPEELVVGYNVDRLYYVLSMISFSAQIIFTSLFAFFSMKAKSWSWIGSIILISYVTVHTSHRLIVNSGRHIFDDSINWTFSIVTQIILVVIGVYIIYLLTRTDVKKYFKKA